MLANWIKMRILVIATNAIRYRDIIFMMTCQRFSLKEALNPNFLNLTINR